MNNARKALGRELRYLREAAGLSGRQLADIVGETQTDIHRMEKASGKTLSSFSAPLVWKWLTAVDADEAAHERVSILVESVLRGDVTWREKLGDRTHLQDEIRDLEAESSIIRDFQLSIIPGLLQTPEYARYIIRVADVEGVIVHEESLAGRLRRQEALYGSGRQFTFLISEAALHRPVGMPGLLAAQLDRIVSLAPLQAVDVAILPLGEPPEAVPWSGFVIYEAEEPCVEVELTHPIEMVCDPGQVQHYRDLYLAMWDRALKGSDAVTLLQRVVGTLRERYE